MPPKRQIDSGSDPDHDIKPTKVRKRDLVSDPNVEYRESTVKMALGSWLRDGYEDLHATIHDVVHRMTKLMFEASRFLNLTWMHCDENIIPFPKLDQTFITRVFYAVAETPERERKTNPALVDPLIANIKTDVWDPMIESVSDSYEQTSRRGLHQVLCYAARRFITATQNHVSTNIHVWVARYLLWKIRKHAAAEGLTHVLGKEITRKIANHLIHRVLKFQTSPNVQCEFSLPPSVREQLEAFPTAIDVCDYAFFKIQTLLTGLSLNPFWVEKNWTKFWSVMSHIRKLNEKHRTELKTLLETAQTAEERKHIHRTNPRSMKLFKSFNLLPDFAAQAKYIDIDSDALLELMVESNEMFQRPWEPKITLAQFKKDSKEDVLFWWRKVFRLEKVTTQNRVFGLRFSTDGIGVSIGVRVPRGQSVPFVPSLPSSDELYEKRVIGVDEGRIDLWVAADGATDDGSSSLVSRGSNAEYYHRAGFLKARCLRHHWKRNDKIDEIEVNIPPSRVSNMKEYLDYLIYVLKECTKVIAFYCSKKYRRLRFKAYMGRQRAQEEMTDKFVQDTGTEPSRLIVAFGAAKFSHNSPGHATSLNGTWLRRNLRKRGVTVTPDIDEFMTSQTCSKCEQHLPKRSRFWQVKSCPGHCLTAWNRDVNAANNIRAILISLVLTGARPEAFQRTSEMDVG